MKNPQHKEPLRAARTGTDPRIGADAGVPYVALPPVGGAASAPLVVVWHMMDAPHSAEAMAAALPLAGLDAWRVFLDLPLHGFRTPDDIEAVMGDAVTDPLLKLYRPLVRGSARELRDALGAALVEVPGMAHALAEEPGAAVAPQTPHSRTADAAAVDWLGRHLAFGRPGEDGPGAPPRAPAHRSRFSRPRPRPGRRGWPSRRRASRSCPRGR